MLALISLLAAPPYSPEIAARLVGSALTDGVAYARAAELTDGIGPRLSGSAGAEAAVKWAVQRFRDDGLEVRTEPVKVPHWVRGEERGEVLPARNRSGHLLALTALGGSPGTPQGGISADVVEVRSIAELQSLGDKARGKIVFFNHSMSTAGGKTGYGEASPLRNHGPAEAAKVGAAGALVRSLATASLRDPHTGATPFPTARRRSPRPPSRSKTPSCCTGCCSAAPSRCGWASAAARFRTPIRRTSSPTLAAARSRTRWSCSAHTSTPGTSRRARWTTQPASPSSWRRRA